MDRTNRKAAHTLKSVGVPAGSEYLLCARGVNEGPFGRLGASTYDSEAENMPRRYRSARMIQNELVTLVLKSAAVQHPMVVDLGCGTSTDGVRLLSMVRNAIY